MLLGDGSGDFSAAATSLDAAGDGPASVAVGDFNGDGKPDLAVANQLPTTSRCCSATAAATSAPPPPAPTPPATVPLSVAVGDFNGDGKPDLATANASSRQRHVLLGDGSGNFSAAATSPETAGTSPFSVAVGDFNGDGKPDLATANGGSDNVTILLGDGSGNFTAAATSPETAGDGPISVAVGDFNGDGKPDLATGNANSDNVTILLADDPTVAGDDAKTVSEDSAAATLDVRANDTDSDSANEQISSVNAGAPAHGAVAITNGGDNLTYTPEGNYCGDATFTYTLTNGGTASVAVTVSCVEDPAAAANDSTTVGEDAAAATFDVRANDTDNDTAKDKIASVDAAAPAHGSVAITNAGDDLTYTPEGNYCGAATFTYTLTGGGTASVAVTVSCVDDAPVAVNDAASVDQGSGATPVDALSNDSDVDGGPKQVASVTQPANGTAAVAADGSRVTYAPAAGYCNSQTGGAPDTFTYRLASGSEATVAVTVTCAAPRMAVSHRRVVLVRNRVVLRLICRGAPGQRCAGSLTLKATNRDSRVSAAAAGRARFNIAAGRSATIRVQPTRALSTRVRKRRRAVAELTARMTGDGATRRPLKRLITVHARR